MTGDGLKVAKRRADGVRYSQDRTRERADHAPNSGGEHFRFSMATNGLRVSSSVTPSIALSLDNVLNRLGVPSDSIEAYVYNSADIQAMCCMVNVRAAVLSFSSGLVNLLSPEEFEFVAGHELGHFLLGHEARSTNIGSLEYFRQFPAQEISADRIGLIGCRSLEAGVRALIKTGCGLGDEHLRFDVSAYISQLRDLKTPDLRRAEMPTHPSMAVRCRALLWFSMHPSAVGDDSGSRNTSLAKLDGLVAKDLQMFCEQPVLQDVQLTRDDYLLWYAAYTAVEDGRLEKYEQAALQSLLVDVDERVKESTGYTYNKLMNLVTGMSAADVLGFVGERLDDARKLLIEKVGSDYNSIQREIEDRVDACFREYADSPRSVD